MPNPRVILEECSTSINQHLAYDGEAPGQGNSGNLYVDGVYLIGAMESNPQ